MHPQLEWNRTTTPVPDHVTVLDLFLAWVAEQPDAPAVRLSDGTVFSYAEVDDWTQDTARLLRAAGVRTGERLALVMDRTATGTMLPLAAVRAGAQYVPLDPAWPPARLRSLLDQLDIRYLACDQQSIPAVDRARWGGRGPVTVVCPDPAPDADATEALVDLFDDLALDPDPLVANGFNVRGDEGFTADDLAWYHARVRSLVEPFARSGPLRLADVGCGPGTLALALADLADGVLCVDPSYECVRSATDLLTGAGHRAVGEVCDAAALDPAMLRDRTALLLASVSQFLPDLESWVSLLAHLVSGLPEGAVVVLADLVPPGDGTEGLLAVPRELVTELPRLLPRVGGVEVHERTDGHPALARRYDAVLHVTGPRGPAADPPAPLVHRPARAGGPAAGEGAPSGPGLPAAPSPDHLAYAIFTSGTTGEPKAVQVDHRALVRLVHWMGEPGGFGPGDVLLFTTSFCFDLSVFDTLGVLALGGTVRVASREDLDEPADLVEILEEEAVTVWDSAPAALQMLLPYLDIRDEEQVSTDLRLVMLSGDWVPLDMADRLGAPFPRARLLALGGATECTVWSNSFAVDRVDPGWPSIPYGRPMPNARYYVLDERWSLCGPGEEGDLYIAGTCVADGYGEAPGLTARKFGPDPFADDGSRMYATGDRAAWLPEGLVQFRGRLDEQVKVRGFRIELGEIQAAANQQPEVLDSVAVTHRVADVPDLALFYLARTDLAPDALRARLAGILPVHMVPRTVRRIDAVPTTANGKADRAALRRMLDG